MSEPTQPANPMQLKSTNKVPPAAFVVTYCQLEINKEEFVLDFINVFQPVATPERARGHVARAHEARRRPPGDGHGKLRQAVRFSRGIQRAGQGNWVSRLGHVIARSVSCQEDGVHRRSKLAHVMCHTAEAIKQNSLSRREIASLRSQ